MKSLFSFLDKFPTANRLMNIGLLIIVSIVVVSIIVLMILLSLSSSAKKEVNRKAITPVTAPITSTSQQKPIYPVGDVLESQLKIKENDLKNSRAENNELKKSIKTFADTVDKNFATLQQQLNNIEGRLSNVESNINTKASEKNSLKVIRLDKEPYKKPPQPTTPTSKKGKVLAQVGNVVWIESSHSK